MIRSKNYQPAGRIPSSKIRFLVAHSDYARQYASECDLNNLDELREDASRIGNIGDLRQVDTDEAQKSLRQSAQEKEVEQESRSSDDDDRRGGGSSEECSNPEVDSTFGTLGS